MSETAITIFPSGSASQTLAFETIKHVPLGEIISQVLDKQTSLVIRISGDQKVIIQPEPRLRPLRVLPGYVPEGWKEAIYA